MGSGRRVQRRPGVASNLLQDVRVQVVPANPSDRFEAQSSKTIWLSETPDTESLSWGTQNYRTATLLTLKDKQAADEPVHIINAHLEWHSGDDEGELARTNSAGVIRRESKKFFEANERQMGKDGGAVVLLGDFSKSTARMHF